ncbi:hypothetical protein SISNIDRAFT_482511 [Sistotremastrum niveocremeum HHB9708]|uniref:Uncharacterized protein n=1 Tax=Sistotremastrum niveocremeum HHB9708 TaxID=1314777 RepID=A0A164Y9S9_9AGAM|nr:hypothetical protein SISNIDRAFT_482511 [Sistotremastrum niveocremeum HHB9708]
MSSPSSPFPHFRRAKNAIISSSYILTWSKSSATPWEWPLNDKYVRVQPADLDNYAQAHLIPPPCCPCASLHPPTIPPTHTYRITTITDIRSDNFGKIEASCQTGRCNTSFLFDDYYEIESHPLAMYPAATLAQPGFYTDEHRDDIRRAAGLQLRKHRVEVAYLPRPALVELRRRPMLQISDYRTPRTPRYGDHLRFWDPPANLTLAFTRMTELPIPPNSAQLLRELVSGPGISATDMMHVLDRCDTCDRIMARTVLASHGCDGFSPSPSSDEEAGSPIVPVEVVDLTAPATVIDLTSSR